MAPEIKWDDIEKCISKEDVDFLTGHIESLRQASDKASNPAESVLHSAIHKLSHPDVRLRCLCVLVLHHAVSNNTSQVKELIGELCKNLANNNALSLENKSQDHQDIYINLHKNLCSLICLLHTQYTSKLMMFFKPVAFYLVKCLGSDNRQIATAACEYWASLSLPPVSNKNMEMWIPAVHQRLPRLIPCLIKCIMYNQEHISYLKQIQEQECNGRETPSTLEEFTNLRNYAALALEMLFRIFQADAVSIFKPIIEKGIPNKDWIYQEATILAVGAMCTALGHPRELRDIYATLIDNLIDGYKHPEPLVRSITCFTMQNFVNIDLRQLKVKDPFNKMLKNTLLLLSDSHSEVQELAIQSLSAMIAYTHNDILVISKKLIPELVKADAVLKGRARHHYYEVISHVCGRLGMMIDSKDVEKLLSPMLEEWKNIIRTEPNSNEEDMLMLCQPLCIITIHLQKKFSPYNNEICNAAIPYIVKLSDSGGKGDKGGMGTLTRAVAYIDLISAMFEGQGSSIGKYADTYNLPKAIIEILQKNSTAETLCQSCLALLGHLCQYRMDLFEGLEVQVIDLLQKFINNKILATQNNALWTLSFLCRGSSDIMEERLIQIAGGQLVEIIKQSTDLGPMINATLGVSHLAVRFPDSMRLIILNEEVLVQCMSLLEQHFPRDLEKITILKNLMEVLSQNMRKIPRQCWVHFCFVVASITNPDEAIERQIKVLLRDSRSILGSNGWNKLTQQIGPQVSYALRKRYKLYS